MTDQGLVCAYALNGKGSAHIINKQDLISEHHVFWAHWQRMHPDTETWLTEKSGLPEHIIDALLEEETRPRIVESKEGILLFLRGINVNPEAQPEDMISIRLWVDRHRIISLRFRKLMAVHDIRAALERGDGPHNSGDFIVELCEVLFNRMQPIISDIEDHIDDIEEMILEHPKRDIRNKINHLRRRCITLRRHISPQRDVMLGLITAEAPWLTDTHRANLRENFDQITRYLEALDVARERAMVVQDEISSHMGDSLQHNMYIVSLITAIFLPLSFLTGLFGVNLGGIPGGHEGNTSAFWIFTGVMIAVAVLGFGVLKRKKWF